MGIKKGGGIMKEYTSEIKLYFVGNILKANSVEEYKTINHRSVSRRIWY
jgi:hypothetical protein